MRQKNTGQVLNGQRNHAEGNVITGSTARVHKRKMSTKNTDRMAAEQMKVLLGRIEKLEIALRNALLESKELAETPLDRLINLMVPIASNDSNVTAGSMEEVFVEIKRLSGKLTEDELLELVCAISRVRGDENSNIDREWLARVSWHLQIERIERIQ